MLWFEGARDIDGLRSGILGTAVYVFEANGWFIKMRASFPRDSRESAKTMKAFVNGWQWPKALPASASRNYFL